MPMSRAHRRTRWVVRCCVALPIVYGPADAARAAQSNVLALERHASPAVSATGASEAALVQQHTQRDLSRSAGGTDASRIRHTEQRNFVDTVQPASETAARVPKDAAATNAPGSANTAASATSGTTAASSTMPPVPDERPLWQLLHEHRLADYDRRVAALMHATPSWHPSPALAAERTRQRQEADIAAALQSNDAAALRLAISLMPDAFDCTHIDRVWKAADVFAQTGHHDDIDALYRTIIPACAPDENRIATLYRAEQQLPPDRVDALIALEAERGHRDAQGEVAFARLRYERAIAALGKLPPGSPQAASRLANLAPSIRANRDGAAAALAGWIAHARRDATEAQNWFETALAFSPENTDAKLGLAQVRIEAHDYDAAQSLLDAPALRDDPHARQGRAQIALARANDAYSKHRYDDTLKWLDAAAREGLPATDTAALRGWTLYALGAFEQAAAAFRASYDARHDDDSAQGLAMSIDAMREHGTGPRRTGDGRVDAYLDAHDAQTLYYRKQFVASHAALRDASAGGADPQRIARYVPADLTGIDAPSLTGGLTWSDHIGAAGQGRLDTIGPELQSTWFHGTTQFALQYRQWFINAGTTSFDQTAPGLLATLPTRFPDPANRQRQADAIHDTMVGGSTRAEEMQAVVVTSTPIDAEQKLDWRLALGAAQGAPSGFEANGSLSVGQQTAWGMWSLHSAWEPVRDSLLSWRGMNVTFPDTTARVRWGQVSSWSNGGHLRWQPAPRWTIAAATEGKWLTGTNVLGNEGMSADLSASYDLHLRGFDYFSVGPTTHFLSYRRNENFYTFGQGGYYSPQYSASAGAALQWLTAEGRTWQVRGSVETGWNDTLQHTERCFPFGTTGLSCAGSHDHGPYGSTEVAAVAKLSSRVQIGALATANITPGRDKQFGAALFVRYFFAPRAAVFSSDLPSRTQ